ncbi:MAG: beta-ketoacyl-ACP synthase II [Nitrospirae bacterium]|nr:beta-ketoacyl-ACP synthase II [Nitrospirota bacterium]
MRKRRVVVTGLGVVAPNGIGKYEFWNALTEAKSGVDLIMSFDTSNLNSKIAAQVLDFDPTDYVQKHVAKKTDRFVHFGLASARMALEDSKLALEREDRSRAGVVIGSVFGGVLFHEAQIISGYQKGFDRVNPLSVPRVSTHAVASHLAIEFRVTGPNMSVSTACASGANAIGHAFRIIQNNDADIVFAGGTEAPITAITFSAFCNLQLLSKENNLPEKACRPYDKKRDGFVLGEGGAVLVLEELSHAIKRDAHIYGEIIGYASNCGSYHMVLPEPDGIEAARVMNEAVQEADIDPHEIDYISAYGNATQPYDRAETKSIKRVFGEHAYNIPVCSIKSMIGHTVGASGAIEAVSCFLALENNMIPPTINYENPDPDCDLDYVPNRPRRARLNTALLNSFGVGNNNACIIFRKFADRRSIN